MKIVKNVCYGGFSISPKAIKRLAELNGRCALLEIVEIPDNADYEIDEYDGIETIREKHRTW